MRLHLSNGETMTVHHAETVIHPVVPAEQFDINNESHWESDRAWLFAKVGDRIWTGKTVATIEGVS